MTTWQTGWVVPRSTCSHWGSAKALDQRVVRLPSVALDAGQDGPWMEDAVVGWWSARFVVPQPPLLVPTVQVNEADPAAPVVSFAVPVTLEVPAVVGVPEISPVEVLIDNPAGSPVAL